MAFNKTKSLLKKEPNFYSNFWLIFLDSKMYLRVLHRFPSNPGLHPVRHVPLIWSHCVTPWQFPHISLQAIPYDPLLHAMKQISFVYIRWIINIDFARTNKIPTYLLQIDKSIWNRIFTRSYKIIPWMNSEFFNPEK